RLRPRPVGTGEEALLERGEPLRAVSGALRRVALEPLRAICIPFGELWRPPVEEPLIARQPDQLERPGQALRGSASPQQPGGFQERSTVLQLVIEPEIGIGGQERALRGLDPDALLVDALRGELRTEFGRGERNTGEVRR